MRALLSVLMVVLASSCAVVKNYNATTKYSPEQLQKDYAVFKTILETEHPGLYWYTSKDSMDKVFATGASLLQDSLTETGFRNVLSYVVARINCGHTSVRPSKQFYRRTDSLRSRSFPLAVKIWPDTAIVVHNLNRKDTAVVRGVLLTSIDGRPMNEIVDSLFQYLPADGYNRTHKYQTLSNGGTFGGLYQAVFGYKPSYAVTFTDTLGQQRSATISVYRPQKDTSVHNRLPRPKASRWEVKRQELSVNRSLQLDSAKQVAFMDLNTFTKDARLHKFFKRSFKKLHKDRTEYLVIDLRGNGGGSVTNSNLLTKYISKERFKIADTLVAVKRRSPYGHYQQHYFWNHLFMATMTHKKGDGYYHFTYFERKAFKPKKKYHYEGKVYVLTGGNTFSASTLFLQSIKKQDNVVIVGEETGGGAYGNNAWLIPDVTLPITGVRFRLPLFRLVIDKNEVKGSGVQPTVPALPSVEAIRGNRDYKKEKVLQLIKADQAHPLH